MPKSRGPTIIALSCLQCHDRLPFSGSDEPYDRLITFVHNMEPRQHLHMGFYKVDDDWNLQQSVMPHYQLFLETLHVASNDAGLFNCVGARLAHGVTDLHKLPHYDDSVIWHWNPTDDSMSGYIQLDPNLPIHLQQLTSQPSNLYLIQFLFATDKDASDIS